MTGNITKILVILVIGFFLGYTVANFNNIPKTREQKPLTQTRQYASQLDIPFSEFEDSSLEQVVDYLRGVTRTGVKDSNGQVAYRLNFIIVDPQNTALPINLKLKSIKLDKLCERIAQAAGVRVHFEEDAIVFKALTINQ